jgi:tRNA1Val (adenine37-N6)-methyltransferase
MAAQRNRPADPATAQIDAVELDEAAAAQARANVAASPFAGRITVHNTAIQQFLPPIQYDHILTNPPFYTNSLRSPDEAVNRALHTTELSFPDLLTAVRRLLGPAGTWWVLLPPPEMEKLTKLAAALPSPLVQVRCLHLRHHAQKPVFRHCAAFRFGQFGPNVPDQLCVYEPDGRTYTAAFRALLKPYYLIF